MKNPLKNKNAVIAVVGLGYVGLPLAVEFAKAGFIVEGFDVNASRVAELLRGHDRTKEADPAHLRHPNLTYGTDPVALQMADFVIVAVPTPVYENKEPDLRPVKSASIIVGKNLKRGAIVVYESTVWPGLTEDFCVPLINKHSGLRCGKDWFIAYSPERINPGDKEHTLTTIVKVVAGMDAATLKKVSWLYRHVCKAGVHEATSIKVAEAAKVIENTQRDLNIALMNELSKIFHKLNIPTRDVLQAAATKWNFGKYVPGMVGGHCISVDPFYLTKRAQEAGYEPEVILSGRTINDSMPKHIALLLEEGLKEGQMSNIKSQNNRSKNKNSDKILVMGLTFKENVPDTRNSPTRDLVRILRKRGHAIDLYDPLVTSAPHIERQFGLRPLRSLPKGTTYDGVIMTVAHRQFTKAKERIRKLLKLGGVLVDVRGAFANPHPPKGVLYKTL